MDKEYKNKNPKQLEAQNEALLKELFKLKSKPQGRIGYIFLIIGVILFAFSIDFSSSIIAFLSLTLLFWGGLFLYIRPTTFVRQEILLSTIVETYSFLNKIISSIDFVSTPYYVSPKTLSGFKDVNLLIPLKEEDKIDFEDLISASARSNFIEIPPLGIELSKLIEEETKQNFSTISLERLLFLLEKVFVEDFELVTEFEAKIDDKIIQVKIVDSIFDGIYDNKKGNNKYYFDYISSVIACTIAKSTHRPVRIESFLREENTKITITDFRIL